MGIIAAVLSGFGLALAAPGIQRVGRGATGWLLALLPLGLTVYFVSLIPQVAGRENLSVSVAWVPRLGLDFSFYVDGLSLLFALLISGVGALILVYSGGYLAGSPRIGQFYGLILMFMASMLGLVLAGNVILLFVFWELTSISSFLLIGFEYEKKGAPEAAWKALMVTAVGGQAMLAGLLLMGLVGGSFDLPALLQSGSAVRQDRLYLPILVLILAGAFTKSAQVPLHSWLPAAMVAPTPVSAYLHSATMVKAGIYLVARLSPVLGETVPWHLIVTTVGAVTMVVGAFLALEHTDFKAILAYATISVLGVLILLLGIGTSLAVEAAVLYLLVHGLYKGTLFLVAGIVDHETGTRDVQHLGGLRRVMPLTAVAAVLAALSMAGVPPFFGFVGKELLYDATLHAPRAAPLLTGITVLSFVGLVAVAGVASLSPFFGRRSSTPQEPQEAPPSMWLGAMVLSGLGLGAGLATGLLDTPLIAPAVEAVLGEPAEVTLQLWHGLTPMLALSVISIAGGFAVYLARGALRPRLAPLKGERWGPDRWYDRAIASLNWLAYSQTRLLQNGHLDIYVLMVVVATVGLVGGTLLAKTQLALAWPAGLDIRFYDLGLAALILISAVAATRTQSRLATIASLGVVGYGVALVFILFGAPDVAMVQFLIETVAVVLYVLVFYRLPPFAHLSRTSSRVRDALAALAAGGLVTVLLLAAFQVQLSPSISSFFLTRSLEEAHGRNVVNVILTDFRALDTLGEITVLTLAGAGVYTLLKLHLSKRGG